MARVLVLAGDAAESLEVMYPCQRLLEERYEVHIAAPTKKKLRFVVHDFEDGFDTYTEKPGYSWAADIAFADVDPTGYVALVIPGGRAPEYIRNDKDFQRIVRHFFEADKPVAQILPCSPGPGYRWGAEGPAHRRLPRSRLRRRPGRCRVRRRRRRRRRPHGLGPGVARPPVLDAGIYGGTAGQGAGDLTLAPHRYRGTTVTGPRVPGAARSLTFLALFAAAVTEGRFG